MSARRIAGQRDGAVVHIDYAGMVEQAVENERWRVYRAVLAAVNCAPDTQTKRGSSYLQESIDGQAVKQDILARINRLADEARP